MLEISSRQSLQPVQRQHIAGGYGTISNASSLKDELEEVLTGISVGLKKQKSRIGKSHLLIPDWEEFQKGRFQSIQNFYTTSLRKLYMLTIPVEDKRDHLFTLSTAFAGDLFYTNGKSENSYYPQIEKTTPWEVAYVKPYYNGSEISLPIHSKKNAGGDF